MNKTLNVFTNELVILYIEDVDLNAETLDSVCTVCVILYIEDVDLNIPVPAEMLPDPESSSTLRMWI